MLRLLTLILALLSTPTSGQTEPVPDRLGKLQSYLERNPLHETVFERLLHEAVEVGALAEVETGYAARLERDGGDEAARILLARLWARTRPPAALGLLADLERRDAPFLYLRGQLQLANGDRDGALVDLETARSVCVDPVLAGKILTLAGRTWSSLGRSDDAMRAFQGFAELDPENFVQRLEAAALLAENGIHAAALVELHRAVNLARGDAAREVRAWVAIAQLEERRGRVEAQAAYAQAARLLGPGNWQRNDLFEHRLALHQGLGSLPELIDACRADVRASPSDPDLPRYLARALRAAGRGPEALQVALQGTRDFPHSLPLGRAAASLLVEAESLDAAVEEYQRLASLHPAEPGLHREAGVLLAALDRMGSAQEQWALELARDASSVDLHLYLAQLHEQFRLNEAADELLRKASDIAPGDLRPVRARADRWRKNGLSAHVVQLLEQTQRAAAKRRDAFVLEELAYEWLAREDARRAIGALEQTLEAGAERRRILGTLVVVLEENGRSARALEVLLELFDLAPTARERRALAGRIAEIYSRLRGPGRLASTQRRVLRRDPDSLRATLLLADSLVLQGEHEEAHQILSALAGKEIWRQDALVHLAWLEEQRGEYARAAVILRELLEVTPHDRRRLLEDIVRLHRRADDEQAVAEAYDELLALSPTNQSVLVDLAKQHQGHRPWWAVKLMKQSLQLNPRDDDIRLDLALLYMRLGVVADAREHLLGVLRADDPELRRRAREAGRTTFSRLNPGAIEVEALRQRLEDEPERFEIGILLALLGREEFDYRGAHGVVEGLLQRFPLEPALLEMREELRGLTLEGLRWGRSASPVTDAQLELAELFLSQAVPEGGHRARAILEQIQSPVSAANLCLAHGAIGEAGRILSRATREDPDDAHLWMRLAVAELAAGRSGRAVRAVDEAVQRSGQAWHLVCFQSELQVRRGYGPGMRAAGRRMLRSLARSRALAAVDLFGCALHERRVARVVEYHVANDLERDFLKLAHEILLAEPGDPPLLEAVLSRMKGRHGARARTLLAAARAAPTPAGWSYETWQALLERHSDRLARK